MRFIRTVKSLINCVGSNIRSRDMFSKPISFTYKGEESFSTLIGGVVSIAILGILMAYGAVKFMAMIYKADSNTSFNKIVTDLSSSDTVLNIGSSTFYFGMGLLNGNQNLLLDSTYLDTKMYYITQTNGMTASTSIGYDTCK